MCINLIEREKFLLWWYSLWVRQNQSEGKQTETECLVGKKNKTISVSCDLSKFVVSVVLEMAAVPMPGYQAFWADKRASFQAEYKTLTGNYPDADTLYRQLFKVLCDIEDVLCSGRVLNGRQ
jgi:hypothetical protein